MDPKWLEYYLPLTDALNENTLKDFPEIDSEKCIEMANTYFTPYLFYKWAKNRKYVELWASCCNRHGALDVLLRSEGEGERAVLDGRHNDKVTCPFCGAAVTMKAAGRVTESLSETRPFVILSEMDGSLYARAYWVRKNYTKIPMESRPRFYLVGAYRFSNGMAVYYFRDPWNWNHFDTAILQHNYDPVHRKISEPFTSGYGMMQTYEPYYVLGLTELDKSNFKYCQYYRYDNGIPMHRSMMKYLAAASIYPRQIEMLMKTGGEELVRDLVDRRRKNKRVFDWNKTDYLDAFGLNKMEMREWRESGASMYQIAEYKTLKRKKLRTDFLTLAEVERDLGGYIGHFDQEFLSICKTWKILPHRAWKYLKKNCGKREVMANVWQLWKDWIGMSDGLGYDMTDETILFPSDLRRRHDEASTEIITKSDLQNMSAAEIAASIKRREAWRVKYNVERDGYLIRIAESSSEIVQEGNTLKHCVGGYAQRHMAGKLTILFLRSSSTPEASLYTIEMNGNTLKQIHGYMNEHYKNAKDPRKEMAWLLDPWLLWLKKGSPRDKAGNPKWPRMDINEQQEVKTA